MIEILVTVQKYLNNNIDCNIFGNLTPLFEYTGQVGGDVNINAGVTFKYSNKTDILYKIPFTLYVGAFAETNYMTDNANIFIGIKIIATYIRK